MVDGCYKRLVRMALNVNQYAMRITNAELYGNLPKVSSKVVQRRLRPTGHAQQHPELMLHSVLLWEPLHSRAQHERPHLTYVDTLRGDTGLHSLQEIARLMDDRDCWSDLVHGSQEYYPT